jgi:hypothetical protein
MSEKIHRRLSLWNSPLDLSNGKKCSGSVTVLPQFLEFPCYSVQFILHNVPNFKSMPLPVSDSFSVTACIQIVAFYAADLK